MAIVSHLHHFFNGAGCEFSRVPTPLTLAIMEAKNDSRV